MTDAETNVTALFGVASLPASHVPADVLEMAKDLLAQVERGEIGALAVCYVRPNRAVCTDWASGSAPHNLLISASSQLSFALLTATPGLAPDAAS